MKSKAIIPLIVGLVIGIIAIQYTVDTVNAAKQPPAPVPLVKVVFARQDITPADYITEDMLELREVPKASLLPRQTVTDVKNIIQRVPGMAIPAGVPVFSMMLKKPGATVEIPSRLEPGERAVAVRIDESSGVAYLVKPGDWVDVHAMMESVDELTGKHMKEDKTILQYVKVGAVGQNTASEEKDNVARGRQYKTITLIIKKDDVSRLNNAKLKGEITLALRSPDDDEIVPEKQPHKVIEVINESTIKKIVDE